ncbi:MAG: glycosyltransferase family 4 protein [Elusimicrobia bacterium]|nr:glycosyltransferase family 4 protein [Elusimicrobiota bacterium]
MRIAVTCYESLGLPGGSALQVLRLAEGLAAAGHEVIVYSPGITTVQAAGVSVVYIPVINLRGLRFPSYLLAAPFFLAYRFLRSRPDAVLAFEVYFDCSVLLAAKLAGAPLHAFINAIAEQELDLGGARLPLKWALHAVQRLLVRSARGLFTVSEEISAWLADKYGVPPGFPVVVKNGVDTKLFSPRPRSEAVKTAGLPESAMYVGFVGCPAVWHGLEYLADAAPLILREFPAAKFLIVGDGPALPAFREYVSLRGLEKDFLFIGAVPHGDVPAYIGACELCVVLFRPVRSYPGDPMKIYEYLACGRPVVASAVPGYGDFVEAAGAGVSADASNPAALASAINKLLLDAGARARMGQNARQAAESGHSWAARAEKIANELAGGR